MNNQIHSLYYLDRDSNRFLKVVNTIGKVYTLKIGEKDWTFLVYDPKFDVALYEPFEITQCSKGHDRTPENLCMSKDGYLRCRKCRASKTSKALNRRNFETEITENTPINTGENSVEFNCNSKVYRDRTKPGWGEVALCLNLSRKEAGLLGQALIDISNME